MHYYYDDANSNENAILPLFTGIEKRPAENILVRKKTLISSVVHATRSVSNCTFKNELKHKILDKDKDKTKEEIIDKEKDEILKEVKVEVKDEVKVEVKEEVKDEILVKVKDEIANDIEDLDSKKNIQNDNGNVRSEYLDVKLLKIPFLNNIDSTVNDKLKLPWMLHLENIKKMRIIRDAPVDLMGCHTLADPDASPKDQRYQILLSLMLSSQTKDEMTSACMTRLKNHGCSVENILATDSEILQKLIYPVGFYKRKTLYIKKSTEICRDQYAGDIPPTLELLQQLPGVGPKMAHLVMLIAHKELTGIAVDTHVHRISNRLGWVKTKVPDKTRKELEDLIPRCYWDTLNHTMVGFGQQICQPLRPQCSKCLNSMICPSSQVNNPPNYLGESKNKKKKIKKKLQ